MKIYRFGNCYLNLTERRVLKNGKYLELTSKTFDVLQLLVENCGEVVTKDEILGKVWNGSFVEEGNLAVQISKLRRILDESKTEPFIETVQGSGYRFISSIKAIGVDEWHKNLPVENHSYSDKSSREFTFDSIAVLPLVNESSDAEIEYLADGLTESFINSLSRVSGLKVIARNTVFRYKNKDIEAKEVGETLGVTAILTGRIRLIKDNLMISVELTKTADGTQIWGKQFNQPFSDIIEVQEKITFEVSEKLKSEIGNAAKNSLTNPVTSNAESYRFYLKGKYLLEKRSGEDVFKAIECFQKSVSFDPMNVYSYVEAVECYQLLYGFDYFSHQDVLTRINPLLSILSELDQNIDVVQAMQGGIKMYLHWEFREAEQHFHNAFALNQNCLIARYRYSNLLLLSGRFSEALKELHQIMLVDPLSLLTYKWIGRLFYKMKRFENAIVYLKDVLELEPNDFEALMIFGSALTELGKYSEALTIFQNCLSNQQNLETKLEVLSMIGIINARKGEKDKAHQIIEQIQSQSKDKCQHALKLARIYMLLDNEEMAYVFLEQALEQHDVDLIALTSDPRWAATSHKPRFKEFVSRIGISSV
jgi:TolB-like protein/tetratricopeptide (TPR) repeat protein